MTPDTEYVQVDRLLKISRIIDRIPWSINTYETEKVIYESWDHYPDRPKHGMKRQKPQLRIDTT